MFTTELPAEIVILVLSYLPLASLSTLLAVSKEWEYFIDGNMQNRNTIYRNAAYLEGYIDDPAMMLEDLGPRDDGTGLYSERTMRGVETWKDFCRKRRLNIKAWAGRGPSTIIPSTEDGIDGRPLHQLRVHRIKVDELVGITLETTQIGGLMVRDMETEEVLWQLPGWYVRQYAHLEYEKGYMIFDRDDGNKEVWRRTAGVYEPTDAFDPISVLDERQQNVVNYLASPAANPSVVKGRFTPHAVLHMPEPTRAYRFVYPTLLVASLERAYLWDVRNATIIQIIENIQVIRELDSAMQWLDQQEDAEEEEQELPPELSEVADTLLGSSGTQQRSAEQDDEQEQSDEEEEENQLPQFLGLVRYVELSERHVFFAGRYLLRIFSRETGKCILDIPSTKWRYGRWRWEVASKRYAGDTCDTLDKAQEEGREAVRVPLKFNYEQYTRRDRLVMDQFVAVHVTSDGKHFAALLSGSRLVVIHHFEDLVNKHNLPDFTSLRFPILSGSTPAVAAETSCITNTPPSSRATSDTTAGPSSSSSTPFQDLPRRYRLTRTQRRQIAHVIRQAHICVQENKKRELFENTIDVQLGPPAVSSSVYLAYEHGRIGVVTTNAVYVVIPEIPVLNSPTTVSNATSATAQNGTELQALILLINEKNKPPPETTVDAPYLQVTRFPFFSNPSWLSEVSCLMMSDAGLFLNWNPDWPDTEIGDHPYDDKMKKHFLNSWDQEYEDALQHYEDFEHERYSVFANGHLHVTPVPRDQEDSEISTIYSVNFLPSSTAAPTSPGANA